MVTKDINSILEIEVNDAEVEPNRVLWLSVILQSLSDALSNSNNYPFNKRRDEALEWFAAKDGEGSDFATVCALAGIDFHFTKQRVSMFLKREIPRIDFRCVRKGDFGGDPQNRSIYLERLRKRDERKKPGIPTRVVSSATFRNPPLHTDPANSSGRDSATIAA